MSVITHVPEPNLWEEIVREFDEHRPPFRDDDTSSVHTMLEDFNPAIHNPVFYGKMIQKITAPETDIMGDVDTSCYHPATIGHAFVDRPIKSPAPPPPPLPDLKACSPREYLEAYIFPVLLPALEAMLAQAKLEKCFERKRTKFNGCDFLTEYLYNKNHGHDDRENVELGDIPFVAEHWKLHPRPPLPMSLLWTEEEATLIIQSHFRGYKARLDPQIQDLRRWQREWREENANIKNKVDDFWAKQMPDGDSPRLDEDGNVIVNEDETEEEGKEVKMGQSSEGENDDGDNDDGDDDDDDEDDTEDDDDEDRSSTGMTEMTQPVALELSTPASTASPTHCE